LKFLLFKIAQSLTGPYVLQQESMALALPTTAREEGKISPVPNSSSPGISGPIITVNIGTSEGDGSLHHISFNPSNQPRLLINEPSAYFCPQSTMLTHYDSENGEWKDGSTFAPSETADVCTALVAHFSTLSIRTLRHNQGLTFDESRLDPQWDYDFTTVDDGDTTFMRNNWRYRRPCGWYRFALKVKGLFDNGSDAWLGTTQDTNVWPVAYHGTTLGRAIDIASSGLQNPSKRHLVRSSNLFSCVKSCGCKRPDRKSDRKEHLHVL